MKSLSIIIPVYNEESNIVALYTKIKDILANFRDRYECDFIFVNDGSADNSQKILDDLCASDQRVKAIEFSKNFGKEVALSAGINITKSDAAITIDCDLQHPPEMIPEFLRKWEDGFDVVVGVRLHSKSKDWCKKIGSIFFYKIMNLIGEMKLTPNSTDFRLIDRKVMDEFNRLTEHNRLTRGLLDWLGFRRVYLDFEAAERQGGEPGYNKWKLIKLALTSFITQSLLPLKLAGYVGIFIMILSGGLGLYVLLTEELFQIRSLALDFSGTAELAILIIFLIGLVLSCLGLIALYIANIYSEVRQRPLYIIRRKINIE